MASESTEIREAIEHTKDEMGSTVKALAHKVDVKARARDKAQETKHKGQESVHHAAKTVADATKPAKKVASKKKFGIPLGAVLAGAGGVFLALRTAKTRQGDLS